MCYNINFTKNSVKLYKTIAYYILMQYIMHHNNKVMQDIMNTYHITPEIYEELANRCDGTFTWDCIELADGYAIIFASKFCKPRTVSGCP